MQQRIVAVFTIAIALAIPARAQTGASSAPIPTIVMTGEASVTRAPDVAFVMLAVESRAKASRDAERRNAEVMGVVQQQLAALGIPKDQQRTMSLSLQQQFDEVNGRRTPREFLARHTLEVRLSDVTRAGEVADAVVQAGATSILGIRFDIKDRAEAERDALRLAVAGARGRAEAAAAGAGRMVDQIVKIEDRTSSIGPPHPMVSYARAEAGAATVAEPGVIEVHAQVELTVSMK